jgi:hypothetical protein
LVWAQVRLRNIAIDIHLKPALSFVEIDPEIINLKRTNAKPITPTHSATWALELLSQQQYGRNPRALGWSVS